MNYSAAGGRSNRWQQTLAQLQTYELPPSMCLLYEMIQRSGASLSSVVSCVERLKKNVSATSVDAGSVITFRGKNDTEIV